MRRVVAFVLALCAGLAAAAPCAGAAPLPADFFGVYSEDAFAATGPARAATLQAQRQAGFGVVRLPLDWSAIQPDPDRWRWEAHDQLVLDAAHAGMAVLPFLVQTPGWARAPEHSGDPGIWPPQFPNYIVDFAAAATRRYGRGGTLWRSHPDVPYRPITAWQIWNEPNLPPFRRSGPDPVEYTRLLESAARGIRSVDPEAEVVSAGMPDIERYQPSGPAFLARMYEAGAAAAMDTVAVHPYAHRPEQVLANVEAVADVVARHGDDAPVWATEFGWATAGPSGWVTDEGGQAERLAGALRLLAGARERLRLRGIATYSWRDSVGPGWMAHAGLRRLDNSPKPALFAVRDAIAELRRGAARPEPPGTGPQRVDEQPAADAPPPARWSLRIATRQPMRAARGRVAVGVRCGGAAAFCLGSVWLETAPGRKPVRLGSRAFRAGAGKRARVAVRLTPAAQRLLARRTRTRVVIRAAATDLHARDAEAAVRRWLTAPLRPTRRGGAR